LRPVDASRSPNWFRRGFGAVAATRWARFISRHVSWKLDPLLLRLTRGRLTSALVFPTALLETRGARSGAVRRNAVIYFYDGNRVTIAASNAGNPRHPSWYHNVVADPDVTLGGVPMRAMVVDEADHARLWALGDRVFPAFARYRRDAAAAGRMIPLIQLTPRSFADRRG
jgi:deazaflavin-dependent oxidoreductase (nitroreductase family)